jgi:hypothetical protein
MAARVGNRPIFPSARCEQRGAGFGPGGEPDPATAVHAAVDRIANDGALIDEVRLELAELKVPRLVAEMPRAFLNAFSENNPPGPE